MKQFYPGIVVLTMLMFWSGCSVNRPDPAPHKQQLAQFGQHRLPVEVHTVLTGLDVLEANHYAPLQGKTVAVVCNHTALDKQGNHIVDLLANAPHVKLKVIFAPEHGYRGQAEGGIALHDTLDAKSGAMVYSIYGKIRKPTPKMLAGIDMIVFDIQDVGARFYTYITTMGNVMEAGAEQGIPVMILDRPNPISGYTAGNVLDPAYRSFVGNYPIPIQHGLTVGELARMIQGEGWINAADRLQLHVVKLEGWTRDLFFNETDLNWVDPSPNMRNLNEALVYPGLCLLEPNTFSEGRGTKHPFEWVGAPYINSTAVAKALYATGLKGFSVEPITFVPQDMPGYAMNPKFEGETVNAIKIRVIDPRSFEPVKFGVSLLVILKRLYPRDFKWRSPASAARLWGSGQLVTMIAEGKTGQDIIDSYAKPLAAFIKLKQQYLLYSSSGSDHL